MLEEKDKYGHWIYKGICNECGYIKYSHYGDFSGKKSRATVCKHVELGGRYLRNIKWENQRLKKIFQGMKRRCYDQSDESYIWYGAKGVAICDEWLDNPKCFEDWAFSNGYQDDLTIDRLDETKNYSPENCIWISLKDNARYKSTTSMIDVDGVIFTGREWAERLGFGINRINIYIREHGEENVKEFIRRFLANPNLKPDHRQSYYDLYMNN